jgi:dihydroorotate dehydrogenase
MYVRLIRPLLFRKNPEKAHQFALHWMDRLGRSDSVIKTLWQRRVRDPRLRVSLFDGQIVFPNILGMAAGFNKDALPGVTALLLALGFGHVEVGTVLPLLQGGNPTPRIFRLEKDRAIINRMGFPSGGMETVRSNLIHGSALHLPGTIIGVNLGPNKSSVVHGMADSDYERCLRQLWSFGDYLVINVSSPNTTGLRELQGEEAINQLLAFIHQVRLTLITNGDRKPIFLKVSPDLATTERTYIAQAVMNHHIDGIIATNTTTSRSALLWDPQRDEQGGLSGKPLFPISVEVVRDFYRLTNGTIPIIGIGGVSTAQQALQMIWAGASLVQVYSGLIYEGPGLPNQILKGVLNEVEQKGYDSVQQMVGLGA